MSSASSVVHEALPESDEGKIQIEWGGVVYSIPVDTMPAMLASLGQGLPSSDTQIADGGCDAMTLPRNTAKAAATGLGRQMAPLEAARSVEEAIKAKEKLAQLSVESAALRIAQRRQQLEEQQRLELAKLREEEALLQRMQKEVKSGPAGIAPEVAALRQKIERAGHEIQAASRDVDK